MHRKNGLVYIALVLAMVCWAFSFIWVKVAYVIYAPLTTVLFRLIIASVFMFLYSKLGNKLMKISREDYHTFLEKIRWDSGRDFRTLYCPGQDEGFNC